MKDLLQITGVLVFAWFVALALFILTMKILEYFFLF